MYIFLKMTAKTESDNHRAMNDIADQTPGEASSQTEFNAYNESPWQIRFRAIHHKLRDRITLLYYPPDTRLNLDELAKEFEVSRTPIRTVLQRLEHEGFVTTRHGVGTIVNDIDFDSLREVMSLRIHLAELIGKLDPSPVQPGAVKGFDQLIERLDQLRKTPDLQEFASIDLANHKQISSLIGNSMLHQSYDEMYYRNARMWFYFLPQLNWDMEISAFTETVKLQRDAMAQGDIVAVGFITRNAISNVVYRINHLLNSKHSDAAQQKE